MLIRISFQSRGLGRSRHISHGQSGHLLILVIRPLHLLFILHDRGDSGCCRVGRVRGVVRRYARVVGVRFTTGIDVIVHVESEGRRDPANRKLSLKLIVGVRQEWVSTAMGLGRVDW